MKKFIISIVTVLLVISINCGDDPVSNNSIVKQDTTKTDTLPTPQTVGTWIGYMREIPPYLNDSLRISVIIKKDSTFKLNAIYLTSSDTAIRDNGFWKTPTVDSIILHGNDCAVYDTTKKVLKQLETCGDPAAIKIDITEKTNTWIIPLKSLAPLSVAFNVKVDDPKFAFLLSIFSIELIKQQSL